MRFGRVSLNEAVGAILAHSVAVDRAMLKKGRVLNAGDIALLRASGHADVMVAVLEDGDAGEDEAAGRIGRRVAGAMTRCAAPFTGRANIYATAAGIVAFDTDAINRLNSVDERVTIATVGVHERVTDGQMIATVKIIPFAVPGDVLGRVETVAEAARLDVKPFQPRTVGLVVTQAGAMKDSVLAKRIAVTEARVAASGSKCRTTRCGHTTEAVAGAIRALAEEGCDPLLVFSATAIVDRADVVPAGLVAAGGRIERLGMPVDPGNLLLLGAIGERAVIGIPTCAASPKLNGFDWVLERLLAGLPVSGADIAAMGVGGLLKEIASRPQPREGDIRDATPDTQPRRAPRLTAVVLAGGRGSRMGENKLAAEVGGVPIVRRTVAAILEAGFGPVVVVTGHEPDRVRSALDGLDVRFVHNPDYAQGISTSLKTGIGALDASVDGTFVVLGDMPEIPPELYRRMAAAFSPADGRGIVVPVRGGKRGNPVLWGRQFFAAVSTAQGDTGAKHLIGEYADAVADVEAGGDAVFTDIDTPEALRALRARLGDA